ncbi:hypothetical protein [Amycolatopsis sp. lyj-346]|uniref:hypothetical protein n=1 Tax=Amycolatopsis sp. lyj-346 TaxID=2789289 RepID=UPI0039784CA7
MNGLAQPRTGNLGGTLRPGEWKGSLSRGGANAAELGRRARTARPPPSRDSAACQAGGRGRTTALSAAHDTSHACDTDIAAAPAATALAATDHHRLPPRLAATGRHWPPRAATGRHGPPLAATGRRRPPRAAVGRRRSASVSNGTSPLAARRTPTGRYAAVTG